MKLQKKRKKEITQETQAGGERALQRGIRGILTSLFDAADSELADPKALLMRALRGLAYAVLSFLLGRTSLLLDTYPLGISLLCTAEKKVFYLWAGAVVSAFSVGGGENGIIFSPYIYAASYTIIPVVRMAARCFIDVPDGFSPRRLFSPSEKNERADSRRLIWQSRFGENIYLRMATACVSAFLVSLYAMSSDGYRFYDLFSAMFSMVAAPAFTFLFSGIYSERESRLGKVLFAAAFYGLFFSLVFSLRDVTVFGVHGSVFAAFAATLFISRRKGILEGCGAGLIGGLAVSASYSPAFVLASLASGLLWNSSPFAAVSTACTSALLWGAYIEGLNALTFLVPALLSSSVLVLAADSVLALPRPVPKERYAEEDIPCTAAPPEEEISAKERMERLSRTFSSLAETLYRLSDRLKSPGESEIRAICERSCLRYCKKCVRNDSCRTENYRDYSALVDKLCEVLGTDGRINASKIPEYAKETCLNFTMICEEANTEFAELVKCCLQNEKTELFALDYDAVSHIISEAIDAETRERSSDEELSEVLRRYGEREDVGIHEITVTGSRKKHIFAGNLSTAAEKTGADELRKSLEQVCGFPLTELVFELRGGKVAMHTESARKFSVESAKSVIGAEDEVCGDTVRLFETPEDNFYSVISDGMGSGSDAALTSEICAEFLEKMLEGGNRKETSLKMLNTLLRAKGTECSATVDLMEIDLICGRACFVKSGAAPSFVKRGDKLYKLRSGTVPIGILRAIEAEQLRFDLEDGDVIIMLSDGISQSPEECVWLMEMLGSAWDGEESLGDIADRITERAKREGSRDDISVTLTRVRCN